MAGPVLLHGCDVAASVFYALSRQPSLFVHFVAATSALCRGTSPDHLLLIGIVSPFVWAPAVSTNNEPQTSCSIVVTELTFDRYTLRRILMLSPLGLAMSFCQHRDFPHLHLRAALTEHVSASLGGNSHSNITEAALQLWWTFTVCSASGRRVRLGDRFASYFRSYSCLVSFHPVVSRATGTISLCEAGSFCFPPRSPHELAMLVTSPKQSSVDAMSPRVLFLISSGALFIEFREACVQSTLWRFFSTSCLLTSISIVPIKQISGGSVFILRPSFSLRDQCQRLLRIRAALRGGLLVLKYMHKDTCLCEKTGGD